MSATRLARLRNLWWTLHRWIGIGLAVLLVPIALSGALLVWHDELDSLINPHRYAVSGAALALTPSQYLASVEPLLGPDLQATGIRYPHSPGRPVTVMARQQVDPASGQRPRFFTFFLDPPTGKVLDKMDFRASLVGFLHVFHENLTIPQYNGRQIVGWAGVGMLVLSLTGIWLWWPRQGGLLRALRWRRSQFTTSNLHHLLGFWIAIPLAIVSATGVYLSFPQTSRSLMSSIAPMSPQQRPAFAAQLAHQPALTPEQALAQALAIESGATPVALFLPTMPLRRAAGEGREARGDGEGSPIWRMQLRRGEHDTITVLVDDRHGTARRQPDPLAGDRAAQWMRWTHEGSRGGALWQVLVFLTGVLPTAFAVTGVVMWWRGRRLRKLRTAAIQPAPQQEGLVAAE